MRYKNIEKLSDENIKKDMIEYNSTCDEIEVYEGKISELKRAVGVMDSYIASYDKKKIGCIVDENQEHVFELKHEMNLIRDRIEENQSLCEHEMVNVGHDSHYDYYRCVKCGFEDRW